MKKDVAKKIRNGELSIGTWLSIPSANVAEILSKAGYEWIVVDLEHSSISIASCPDLFRAIEIHSALPLVRLTNNDPNQIKRVLDAGAKGIIVPNIKTKEEAENALLATKYAPDGIRGVGLSRAQGYGEDFESYKEWQKEEILVIVQIESVQGVKNINSILSIEGISAYMIGPYDLTASMGIPGQFQDKEYLNLISQVRRIAAEISCPAGYHLVEPDLHELDKLINDNYSMIAYSVDFKMINKVAREPFKK